MNSMQIKDKLRNVSKEKNVDFNTLLRLYMYDRFIERLAISKYKANFIIKGGFYLSTLFGVESRVTMDIDTAISKATFNEDNIVTMINEIINIDINDNAKLKFMGISKIREEDEYGGFRVVIKVTIEKIRETFSIDIATGDPITPRAINYEYLPTLGDKPISLLAYNIETVLAEKIETILSRGELSSRLRDYYDIYLIYTRDWDNINKKDLKDAVVNTFKKREFNGDIVKTLETISNSEILRENWLLYSSKYSYAKGISYEEIIRCLKKMVKEIW